MAAQHIPVLEPAPSPAIAQYVALTKPDVNLLIAITTLAGFCLGRPASHAFPVGVLIHTLVGTMLVASGAGALNQYVERGFDALMRRTKRRPIAAGRVEPQQALVFGVVLAATGVVYLAAAVNLLASLLATLTLLSYLALYTPLKRQTSLCTLVGAFPGAVPPLIGWAAASGGLSAGAWALYGIVFLWQFPHFMSIAWMYREDYERAGYLVLPLGRRRTAFMAWQSVVPALVLLPASLTPLFCCHAGAAYATGALLFGVCFFYYAVALPVQRTNTAARRLLMASILYLTSLFSLLLLDPTL
jgi:protoheme IX farnesyltransferase